MNARAAPTLDYGIDFRPTGREELNMIVFALAGLFLAPVVIVLFLPIAIVMKGIEWHRVRSAARSFRCIDCKNVLGTIAVELADAAEEEQSAQHDRWNSYGRRRPRTCHAICSTCGVCYQFVAKQRTFAAIDA
jgi:hypothetical protein